MITKYFIIAVFLIIVIYDIWALVKKKGTITGWFRHWYKQLPIIPYLVGFIFIGHFTLFIDFLFLNIYIRYIIFILISSIILAWTIINKLRTETKLFKLFCKHWYIPMGIGSVLGCMWL